MMRFLASFNAPIIRNAGGEFKTNESETACRTLHYRMSFSISMTLSTRPS